MIPLFLAAVAAVFWLGWRAPTAALLIVLPSFAVGLSWVLEEHAAGIPLDLVTPAHATLLLAAMAGSAARHGVRAGILNWPLLVIALLLLQSLVAADLARGLGAREILLGAYALALPFLLVQLVPPPGARAVAATVIGALPLLSVAAGYLLEAWGWFDAFVHDRLHGATNAGWLGAMGYVAFAVALHEGLRTARLPFIFLAAAAVVVTILSASRMPVFACLIHLAVYCVATPQLPTRMGRVRSALLVAAGIVAVALVYYLPVLQRRMGGAAPGEINLSGRDRIWADHYADFMAWPWFGRGLGSTGLVDRYYDLPHNEYLRLLVEGGIVGFALFALAVLLWARQLLARVDPAERALLLAAFASLAVFACTDNVLIMPPTLLLFAYLSFVLPTRLRVAGALSERRRRRAGALPRAVPCWLSRQPRAAGRRAPRAWRLL